MSGAQILEAAIRRLPNVQTVCELNIQQKSIEFNWRARRFLVDDALRVTEVKGELQEWNAVTDLIGALLKADWEITQEREFSKKAAKAAK